VVLFAQMGMTYFVPGALLTGDIEPIFGNIERRAPIARHPAFDKTGAEVDVHGRPRISVGFGQRSPGTSGACRYLRDWRSSPTTSLPTFFAPCIRTLPKGPSFKSASLTASYGMRA
jgi:hypothetical protein